MAAGPKKSPKKRGTPTTGRPPVTGKPVRPAIEVSPSRQHKVQARSAVPVKKVTQKPTRGRTQTNRKAATTRGADRLDLVLAAQLEAITHGLEQITDMRAELEELRTIVDELAQSVAALVANSRRQERRLDQPAPAKADEVLSVETYEASSDGEEESEPLRAAHD